MKGKQIVYRVLGTLVGITGLVSTGLALLMTLGAALVGPLGLAFGIGELSWYDTWRTGLINLIMHLLPGIVAAVLGLMFGGIGALLLWGATAAWRRARLA